MLAIFRLRSPTSSSKPSPSSSLTPPSTTSSLNIAVTSNFVNVVFDGNHLDRILLLYLPVVPILLLSTILLLTTMFGAFRRRWKTKSASGRKKSKEKSKIAFKKKKFNESDDSSTNNEPNLLNNFENILNENKCNNLDKNEQEEDGFEEKNLLFDRNNELLDNCKETQILEDFNEEEKNKDWTNGNLKSDQIWHNNLMNDEEKTDLIKEAWHIEFSQLNPSDLQFQEDNADEKEANSVGCMELRAELEATKENLRLELEQERVLRCDAEKRLEDMRTECDNCRLKVSTLQNDFARMEEVVRGMLAYKAKFEQLKMERLSSIQAYECKMKKYEMCIENLQKENMLLVEQLRNLESSTKDREEVQESGVNEMLLHRLRYLEKENDSLAFENDQQRHQYEKCLDDVANQVVQALLSQKTLREECKKLQVRVSELEQQNRSLSNVFLQRLNERNQSMEFRVGKLYSPALQPSNSAARYSFPNPSIGRMERIEAQVTQSDRSTESLASMCSDYSFNSSASSCGNVCKIQNGNQHLSSPPSWFNESETWMHCDTPCSINRVHPRRSKCYNPDSYSCKEHHSRDLFLMNPVQEKLNNLNCSNLMYETVLRRQSTPSSVNFYHKQTPSCNYSPSEFFDSGLDAIETPAENQTLADDLEATSSSSESNRKPVPRPTTLNLNADDLLNSLCSKRPELNPGNVYVEPNKVITQTIQFSQPIINEKGDLSILPDDSSFSQEMGTKDEGYSTMSSDIQAGELMNRSIEVVSGKNRDDMKDICEEDETDDSGSNFARELATSVVDRNTCAQQKSDPKLTLELLNARSSNIISLFSPQGYKNKIDSNSQNVLSSLTRNGSTKIIQSHTSTCPSLSRTNSDSKIYQRKIPSGKGKKLETESRHNSHPCRALSQLMTKSYNEATVSSVSSMKRSQCQILNRLKATFPGFNEESKFTLEETKMGEKLDADVGKDPVAEKIWEWEEWEPLDDSFDLNGTDGGFFVSSLPSKKDAMQTIGTFDRLKEEGYLTSSPEPVRRSNSPIESFRLSNPRRKKKVASVQPFHFEESDKLDVGSCNSRLSWCSEELNLTGIPPCSVQDELNIADNVKLDELSIDVPDTKFTSDFYKLCHVEQNRNAIDCNCNVSRNIKAESKLQNSQSTVIKSPVKSPTKSAIPVPKKPVRKSIQNSKTSENDVESAAAKSPSKPKLLMKEKPSLSGNSVPKVKNISNGSRIPMRKTKKTQEEPSKIPLVKTPLKKSTAEQIEELNKMLSICGDAEEIKPRIPPKPRRTSVRNLRNRRKKEGCVTSWVHVDTDVDLSDPRARANLLDSMMASSSSEQSSSSDDDTILERQYLHNLHKFRRRKKRESDKDQVIRYIPPIRPSIMNCPEFFYRYGEKEQEAVSYFDFLDEMSTSTPSSADLEEDHDPTDSQASKINARKLLESICSSDSDDASKLLSPIAEEELENHRFSSLQSSQEYESNKLSFSDSCAESFSSSDHIFTNFE